MRFPKAVAVLLCLLITPSAFITPNYAQSTQSDDSSRVFMWGAKDAEVRQFLKANDSLLNQGEGCSLNVSWANKEAKAYASLFNIASFVVVPDDEEVTQMFRDEHSGLDVRVGVRYHPEGPGASSLNIALALEGAADNVFDEPTRSEATTLRDKNFRLLSTAKETRVANLQYTFYLTCVNGRTFLDFLRPKPAHKKTPHAPPSKP